MNAALEAPAPAPPPRSAPVVLYTEGDALYAAMLEDIASARQRIRFEMYIFNDDEVGRAFVQALIAAAARGVKVTLRLDVAGSWLGFSRVLEQALVAAGVVVEWSRRWRWRRPLAFNRRNHRKLVVCDDRCAYLGGFNVHRESSLTHYGPARWRDTHARLEGAVVAQAAELFDRCGRRSGRFAPSDPEAELYLLSNRPFGSRHHLRRALRVRFGAARERIWATTPYFVPDRRTQAQLCRAAQRGVDVRLLLPGKNDVRLVQWASRAAYSRLLSCGVRLYEYQPRVLHAKTLLADDDWCTIGTANLDYRSLFVNDEVNLVAHDPALVARLADDFEADLAQSREIRLRPWKRRPWTNLATEAVGWWARRWL